jgi:hypothetical protein
MSESDIICRLTGRCHDVTLEDWALIELLHASRERLNEGKTARHQNRDTEQDPNRNARVTKAGMAGEVIVMRLLHELGAHSRALEYVQAGMLYADIREAGLKGQADLELSGLKIDLKVNRLFAPTERGYRCNINCIKHHQLVSNGLDGYIFIAVQSRSSVCYVSRLIPHQEVSSWHTAEQSDERKNFFTAPLSTVARLPARLIYNRSELFRPKFKSTEIDELFKDRAFSDNIRSKYPYIDWSLVSWPNKSLESTWRP